MMEIYAGYLEQTDYNVGRVVDAIQQMGQHYNSSPFIVREHEAFDDRGAGSPAPSYMERENNRDEH